MSRRRTGGKPRDKHPPAPTAGATLAAADPVAAAQLPPPALADAGIITSGLCATPADQAQFDEHQAGKPPGALQAEP